MSPSLLNKSIASLLLVLVFCAAQGQSGILNDAFTAAFQMLFSETRGLLATLNDDSSIAEKFEQWMAKYGRSYRSITERVNRFYIFKDNYEYIENFNNAENKSYKLGINEFADLTHDEFLAIYANNENIPGISSPLKITSRYQSRRSLADVPSSINWVERGAVTPIKNQASCGSCWIFSAVAATEGIVQIKTRELMSLSEQQVMDCNGVRNGCSGGWMTEAFNYIVQNEGVANDTIYPYQGKSLTCDTTLASEIAAQISGYEELPANNETALLEAVAQQPVSIVIDSTREGFQFYKSGVYTGECGTATSHAVTTVGYGTSEDGIKYWLLKNSWGTTWGEDGYMRIQRDVSDPRGLCGIAQKSSYPVFYETKSSRR
ncbi:zingipain-2-like [Tripterygium wilfordii]|uniref:zingipain-2-like n=1 Tax=Tripterygium wilfordii TaxID=458696 RepID=UPI0018F82C0C|nr:zingipain-2-like [Tripterygium wilfordii]